jgi:hypothetical protein
MRDLDALLHSLVNVDRASLVAIPSAEAEAAQRLVNSARQRTASQRAKRHEAVQRAARIDRILSVLPDRGIASELSEHDIALCQALGVLAMIPNSRPLRPELRSS